MSALLDVTACSINLLAEYGFASRQFSKTPRVYQSDSYSSCLFLKYQQKKYIPNRIPQYRNHFTLFTNAETVLIARVETTLNHVDNDAVVCYDLITPSDDVNCRMRSSYKNWDVSFDEITYSNKCEQTIDFKLMCHGEWYYFDRGIILNGISAFDPDCPCINVFIYYELHVDHKITIPSPDSVINLIPSIGVIYDPSEVKKKKVTTPPTTPPPTPGSQTPSGGPALTPTTVVTSAFSSLLLPHLNALARPLVTTNDQTKAPKARHAAVIPSLSWFEERQKELCASNIAYFVPISAECYVSDSKYGVSSSLHTTTGGITGNITGLTPFPQLPPIFGSVI